MAIKFKEIRKYISRVVRLSICFDDGSYDNYLLLSDIPEGMYDDMYVYGIGLTDVEFPMDLYSPPKQDKKTMVKNCFLGYALEIVLCNEDRDFERKDNETLRFGDLRNYLQIGKYFSVMFKDEWKPDCYEWRKQIPEKYDDMRLFGIGVEDSPEAHSRFNNVELVDSKLTKRICIVLEK